MSQSGLAIASYFRRLPDPRVRRRSRHRLLDIVVITLCATICGCDDWQQVVTFARARLDWLKRFLRLPNGIPSHDTFERVFDRLDPAAFAACFQDWTHELHRALGVSQVAIDGKVLRGSGPGGSAPLHLLSAWATANRLTLGQVAVAAGSNEIPAIPKLLELLDLNGALVTIDAIGCQTAIAAAVVEKQGDYVLTVKENQPHLLADVQASLARVLEADRPVVGFDTYETRDRGHGRDEYRCYTVVSVTDPLVEIRGAAEWRGLTSIGMAVHQRTANGRTGVEVRYFIGSRAGGARLYGEALRGHWLIENQLHWHLDVTFAEDENRVGKRHGAENLALVRKIAVSTLHQHPDKRSIACKRLLAALDPGFLEEVLRGDGKLSKG